MSGHEGSLEEAAKVIELIIDFSNREVLTAKVLESRIPIERSEHPYERSLPSEL